MINVEFFEFDQDEMYKIKQRIRNGRTLNSYNIPGKDPVFLVQADGRGVVGNTPISKTYFMKITAKDWEEAFKKEKEVTEILVTAAKTAFEAYVKEKIAETQSRVQAVSAGALPPHPNNNGPGSRM